MSPKKYTIVDWNCLEPEIFTYEQNEHTGAAAALSSNFAAACAASGTAPFVALAVLVAPASIVAYSLKWKHMAVRSEKYVLGRVQPFTTRVCCESLIGIIESTPRCKKQKSCQHKHIWHWQEKKCNTWNLKNDNMNDNWYGLKNRYFHRLNLSDRTVWSNYLAVPRRWCPRVSCCPPFM